MTRATRPHRLPACVRRGRLGLMGRFPACARRGRLGVMGRFPARVVAAIIKALVRGQTPSDAPRNARRSRALEGIDTRVSAKTRSVLMGVITEREFTRDLMNKT